jgi:hypothetical protein
MGALLQGAYAHLVVTQFWRVQRPAIPTVDGRTRDASDRAAVDRLPDGEPWLHYTDPVLLRAEASRFHMRLISAL